MCPKIRYCSFFEKFLGSKQVLKSHGWKYCLLIYYERKILFVGWKSTAYNERGRRNTRETCFVCSRRRPSSKCSEVMQICPVFVFFWQVAWSIPTPWTWSPWRQMGAGLSLWGVWSEFGHAVLEVRQQDPKGLLLSCGCVTICKSRPQWSWGKQRCS
jgi:hypothetical protein